MKLVMLEVVAHDDDFFEPTLLCLRRYCLPPSHAKAKGKVWLFYWQVLDVLVDDARAREVQQGMQLLMCPGMNAMRWRLKPQKRPKEYILARGDIFYKLNDLRAALLVPPELLEKLLTRPPVTRGALYAYYDEIYAEVQEAGLSKYAAQTIWAHLPIGGRRDRYPYTLIDREERT